MMQNKKNYINYRFSLNLTWPPYFKNSFISTFGDLLDIKTLVKSPNNIRSSISSNSFFVNFNVDGFNLLLP